jgi:hypothetical protein
VTEETLTPEQAAERAVDPDRLLPGEATVSGLGPVADALHWISVYGELLAFKEELIDLGQSRIEGMSEQARAEAGGDQVLMEREAERFRRRIAAWKGRLDELRASARGEVPPPAPDDPGSRRAGE